MTRTDSTLDSLNTYICIILSQSDKAAKKKERIIMAELKSILCMLLNIVR